MKLKTYLFGLPALLAVVLSMQSLDAAKHSNKKLKVEVSPPVLVAGISRLPNSLTPLDLPFDPETTTGYWLRNVTDECDIAVNPCNPCNMIVGTHQDSYETGFIADIFNYTLDGGKTWNESNVVFSRSQGATNITDDANFQSASDPGVFFDNKGNAYAYTVSFNTQFGDETTEFDNFEEANTFAKSSDGGQSWARVYHTTRDDGFDNFLDKPFMIADPFRKDTLYTAYSDIPFEAFGGSFNKQIFQKSTDAGTTWSSKITVYDFTPESFNWGGEVYSLPTKGHPLVLITMLTQPGDTSDPITHSIKAFRSHDQGDTWSSPITVFENGITGNPYDPDNQSTIQFSSNWIGAVSAVNPKNGYLYTAWQEGFSSQPNSRANGSYILMSMSKDGGRTWSNPIRPNIKTPLNVQSFYPTLAVADDGTVGLLFYDFRNHTSPSDPTGLSTDAWLVLMDKKMHFQSEHRITPTSFDMRQGYWRRQTQIAVAREYIGLATYGNNFHAAITITNPPYGVPNPNPFPLPEGELVKLDTNRTSTFYVKIERN